MDYPKLSTLKKDLGLLVPCFMEMEEMNLTKITETKLTNTIRSLNITYHTLVNNYNNLPQNIFPFLYIY